MPAVSIFYISYSYTTHIKNIEEISKAINTPPEVLLKYISLSLSCSHLNSSFNGVYSSETIQKIIFNFINTFIICSSCDIPELTFKNNHFVCSACGNINKINLNSKINSKLIKFLESYLKKHKYNKSLV
jgi:translation initiation factor 2 beta subunit (eIF-2beta)/eIF-5